MHRPHRPRPLVSWNPRVMGKLEDELQGLDDFRAKSVSLWEFAVPERRFREIPERVLTA